MMKLPLVTIAAVLTFGSLTMHASDKGPAPTAGVCQDRAINCNSTVTGTLESSDCTLSDGTKAELWTFNGAGNQQVTITLRSTAFNGYLELENAAGQELINDNNSAGGTDARIIFTLPSTGTYRILVNEFSLTAGGTYSLELSCSGGASTATKTSFYTVTPCRVHDTRGASGPKITNGSTRTFTMIGGSCGIPADASAVSANFTITNNETGYLTVWPTGKGQPTVSTINYQQGGQYALANAAVIPLGTNGQINVFAAGATDLIIDVNGYFK